MSSANARRGSFPRPKGRTQQDDTEEVRALRAKYSDKLQMIKELFPTWTDEDLLFALQDASGDVEVVVVRISDGLVEQFSSVKTKKQTKKEPATSAPSAPRPVNNDTTATARPARGASAASDRGARGRGGASARGARGGRGGSRGAGGRGGGIAPQANGHETQSSEIVEASTTPRTFSKPTQNVEATPQAVSKIATPTSGTSWAAALGRASRSSAVAPASQETIAADASKEAAPAANGWDTDATPVVTSKTEAPAAPTSETEAPAPAPTASEPTTTTNALSSAVQDSQPAVKVPAPAKSVPKGATMSWAQIARKSEAPKAIPIPAAEPVSAPVQATTMPEADPAQLNEEASLASAEATETKSADAPQIEEPVAEQTSKAEATDAAAPSVQVEQSVGGSSQIEKLGAQLGSANLAESNTAEQKAEAAAPEQNEQAPQAASAAPVATEASVPETRPQPGMHDRQPQAQTQTVQEGYGQQYSGYKSDAFDNSYGFTGQQQPAASHHQGPQDQAQGYTGFNPIGQAVSQQQHQPQQGLQDYASMYGGVDAQRLAQFYGGYDQNTFGQRADDKAQSQQSGEQHTPQPQHPQGHQAGPGQFQHQAPQQQQQFPGIMPYYYPHYYMPNQFQHYGQPGAGYGQYPVYGQQPAQHQQHPKPDTNTASPYTQGSSQNDANNYGAQSQYGQQTPNSSNASAYDQGFGRQAAPGLGGMTDYSKIYGGAMPGLGGFLGGAPPSQGGSGNQNSSGTPHMGTQPKAGGASSNNALDGYRQYDANAGKPPGQTNSAQGNRQGQAAPQPHQGQQHQGQQQQQQQQQYYQQYGAYGHQQNSSAYANYPYARQQYWGQ